MGSEFLVVERKDFRQLSGIYRATLIRADCKHPPNKQARPVSCPFYRGKRWAFGSLLSIIRRLSGEESRRCCDRRPTSRGWDTLGVVTTQLERHVNCGLTLSWSSSGWRFG